MVHELPQDLFICRASSPEEALHQPLITDAITARIGTLI